MPVTREQMEQMRLLEREYRDKQEAYIRRWRKAQQIDAAAKLNTDDTQKTVKVDPGKYSSE